MLPGEVTLLQQATTAQTARGRRPMRGHPGDGVHNCWAGGGEQGGLRPVRRATIAIHRMSTEPKPIKITRHARNRMRWHRVTDAEVVECLWSPSFQEPGIEDTTHYWKASADTFIRVTWLEEAGAMLVITVVRRRKGPKEKADED